MQGSTAPPRAFIAPPTSQPPPEPEMQSPDTGTAKYAGAFFPRSERLQISGGMFTSNVTNITQETPPIPLDFRMIPMGEIYLRYGVGIVTCSTGTSYARRLYSVRLEGKKRDMTVAMYQGDNAEQKWREDLSKYLWLRHPNFLQLYGAASSAGMHAIILHDELIAVDDFERLYRHSYSLMVHICARAEVEAKDAKDYFDSMFHKDLTDLDLTLWIDCSTGRLCIDVVSDRSPDDNPPSSQYSCPMVDSVMLLNEYHRLFPPLTPEQHHLISYTAANRSSPDLEGSVPPIHLASILWSSEGLEAIRVADATNPVINYERWGIKSWGIMTRKSMANGWERYESNNVAHRCISLKVNFERPESWLRQANQIFEQLNVTCNKGNYALVDALVFTVIVEGRARPDLHGYLFLCPPEDFSLPGTSSFRWPNCRAYLSLDPTGSERLSTEAARLHGFPTLRFRASMTLKSWDDSVYAGLREFHESRGFNPDSQDVTRDLGYIIYKVSDEEPTSDDEDSCGSPIHENTVHNLPPGDLATLCSPEDFMPLSRTLKLLMTVKLGVILFIAVSSAYDGVRAQLN